MLKPPKELITDILAGLSLLQSRTDKAYKLRKSKTNRVSPAFPGRKYVNILQTRKRKTFSFLNMNSE